MSNYSALFRLFLAHTSPGVWQTRACQSVWGVALITEHIVYYQHSKSIQQCISHSISDTSCIHCNHFQSSDLNDLMDHCRFCASMARPDPKRYRFVCYGCKSFHTYLKGNIKRHISIHCGRKPFACNYCDYRAVEKGHVMVHIRSRHKQLVRYLKREEKL